MKLLVVGGGGREHALCHALRRDRPHAGVFCAPGNPGTAELATNLPVAADDLEGVVQVALRERADLVVVGPEAPLALGLADRLRSAGIAVFGPSAAAARIEASKAFAKEVMSAAGIATAASRSFSEFVAAREYVERHPEPLVIKASGLAAGKGAVVCRTRSEAVAALGEMLVEHRLGEAGRTVVVEEFLEGEELSVLALTDGREVALLPAAQDHKRLLEGDEGPNTGGMGAYSPVSIASRRLLETVERDILRPVLGELERRGARFRGVLYAGLMVDPAGRPWVIEFNCRFGDPEAQAVLPLMSEGLVTCLQAVALGKPPTPVTPRKARHAVTTVVAAEGYPDNPRKGAPISLPERLPDGATLFHAGTVRDPDGTLRVAGGRVLNVTAVASSFEEAQRLSRETAAEIRFEGRQFRRDIGWRELARQAVAGR